MERTRKSKFFARVQRAVVVCMLGCVGALASAALCADGFANDLKSIRTGVQPGNTTRLVIEMASRPDYTLSYPTDANGGPLMVVQLSNTAIANSLTPSLANGTLVKSISQASSGKSLQLIVALTKSIGDIPKNNIMVLAPNGDTAYRLVIDFTSGGSAKKPIATAPAATAANNVPASAGAVAKPTRKPIIVIDAGHGGKDPGCHGPNGTREKDVVLGVAKKLSTRLKERGYVVYLTRNDDTFLNLDTRAGIGEQRKADLFVSIHANSNPSRDMRGFSVYTLSKTASDKEAATLADAENAADSMGVDNFPKYEPDIRNALTALQQHALAEMSVEFASGAQQCLIGANVTEQAGSLRAANFAVLRSTTPSVLIEIGHLSNPSEEKLLANGDYQQKVANAIAKAIGKYDFGE